MGILDKFFGGEKHSVDRFVGGKKEDQKEAARAMERRFKAQDIDQLKAIERPKSPEEMEMIEIANRETDRLREKYGLPEYHVPPENIHVIKGEKAKESGVDLAGRFSLERQGIIVNGGGTRMHRFAIIFHEMTHFKSFASMEPREDEIAPRRSGLNAWSGEDGRYAMRGLNEAVTEELTKRFIRSHEDHPMLAREMAEIREFRRRNGGEAEDTSYFDVEDIDIDGKKGSRLTFKTFAYTQERQALHLLIDKLKERNPKTFRDKDEWFDMFAGAMFNGHLLELARAIEGTFGKGKFRELGEQKTGEAMLKFVESL